MMRNTTTLKQASELEPGMRVRYLGRVHTVTGVRRSLGNGWTAMLEGGPAATFVGTVGVVVSVDS